MSSIISKLINLAGNITGTLPVANGGTGVTTSTGSVNVVLSNSPTLVSPVLGTPSSGTLSGCTSVGGITSGSAVGAGIIGQVISSTGQGSAVTIGTTPTQLATVSLTAGVWLIMASVNVAETNSASNHGSFAVGLTTNSYTGVILGYTKFNLVPILSITGTTAGSFSFVVSISGTTSYFLNCQSDQGTAAQGDWTGSLIGLRCG